MELFLIGMCAGAVAYHTILAFHRAIRPKKTMDFRRYTIYRRGQPPEIVS